MGEKFHVMIALKEQPAMLEPNQIALKIRKLFPNLAKHVNTPPPDETGGQSCVIPIAGMIVAVLRFAFPIPAETLAGPLLFEKHWSDAAEAMAQHSAHLLLTVIGPETVPIRGLAAVVTSAAAAIIDLQGVNALGVLWSAADQLIEPKRFLDEALESKSESAATTLWVALRFYKGPKFDQDQSIVCRSSGLVAFAGREVEIGPSTQPLPTIGTNVLEISKYLIESGLEFTQGHTIGSGASPDAVVSLGRSDFGGDNMPIFKINFLKSN